MPGGTVLLSEKERTSMLSGLKFYDFDYQLTTTHGIEARDEFRCRGQR